MIVISFLLFRLVLQSPESQSQFDLYKKTLGINDLTKTKMASNVSAAKELKIPSPLSAIPPISHETEAPIERQHKEILPMLLASTSPLKPLIHSLSPRRADSPMKIRSPPIINIPVVAKDSPPEAKETLTPQSPPAFLKTSPSPDSNKNEDENLENKQQNYMENSDEDVWRPW